MIETLDPPQLVPAREHLILAHRKASLACGCHCLIGKLAPELRKLAVHSRPCSIEHEGVVARFRTAYSDGPKLDPLFAESAIDSMLGRAHAQFLARASVERAVGS